MTKEELEMLGKEIKGKFDAIISETGKTGHDRWLVRCDLLAPYFRKSEQHFDKGYWHNVKLTLAVDPMLFPSWFGAKAWK
jgi:hypothetical protein